METTNQIKIALAQTNIVWEDKAENYKKAEEKIKEASSFGTQAIFFPEMSFTGFSMNTKATKEQNQKTIQQVGQFAKKYQMCIGFGWVKDCGERCENHYTIVDNIGNIVSDYAKLHPFSYSGEDKNFQGGDTVNTFLLKGICFSSFVCYDLRFPEIFQAVSKNAHVIVLAANWPAQRSNHWKALLKARAIENQVYMLAVNCVGTIGKTNYAGESCIINPNGDVQVYLAEREGNIYFELIDNVQRFRDAFPVKQDRREMLYCSYYQN